MPRITRILIPAATLVAGVVFGALAASGGTHASATPAVTVTAQARTVTKTVTTNVIPQECLDALDEADHGFDLASTAFGQYSQAITAYSDGDANGAYSALSDVKATTDEVSTLADSYNPDKAACRAAAE